MPGGTDDALAFYGFLLFILIIIAIIFFGMVVGLGFIINKFRQSIFDNDSPTSSNLSTTSSSL
jgi:uncharacterized membrane protein